MFVLRVLLRLIPMLWVDVHVVMLFSMGTPKRWEQVGALPLLAPLFLCLDSTQSQA
jgi:hypothetical protein